MLRFLKSLSHVGQPNSHLEYTSENLVQYLNRWPPSRTPVIYGPWDKVNPSRLTVNSFPLETLALNGAVTLETLDQISTWKAHNVITGKWMKNQIKSTCCGEIRFTRAISVSNARKVLQRFLLRGRNLKERRHVIGVYADDYTDSEEDSIESHRC